MQRFEMVGKWRVLVRKPSEDTLVALEDYAFPIAEPEPCNDLFDQLLLPGSV